MSNANPTSATLQKDRLYGQLAASFARLTRATAQTADLLEELEGNLHAMRVFGAGEAARFMTVASLVTEGVEQEQDSIAEAEKS